MLLTETRMISFWLEGSCSQHLQSPPASQKHNNAMHNAALPEVPEKELGQDNMRHIRL